MSDLAVAAPHQEEEGPEPFSRQPRYLLRRRVTDVPGENEEWFRRHDHADGFRARELARAELTAQRDGYVIRWVRQWACQVLQPVAEGDIIESARNVTLDGTPDTDPRARETEQQLLRKAGLPGNGEAAEPASVERGEHGGIVRRYADCHILWEQTSACQLLEPDGTTLIDQNDDFWVLDPSSDPRARCIAADLLLEAGV